MDAKAIQAQSVSDFKIQLARIEAVVDSAAAKTVVLTFRFERDELSFEVPVALKSREFDDTELVRIARARLSEIFGQLAVQSAAWKLSPDAAAELAKLNRRPMNQ